LAFDFHRQGLFVWLGGGKHCFCALHAICAHHPGTVSRIAPRSGTLSITFICPRRLRIASLAWPSGSNCVDRAWPHTICDMSNGREGLVPLSDVVSGVAATAVPCLGAYTPMSFACQSILLACSKGDNMAHSLANVTKPISNPMTQQTVAYAQKVKIATNIGFCEIKLRTSLWPDCTNETKLQWDPGLVPEKHTTGKTSRMYSIIPTLVRQPFAQIAILQCCCCDGNV
jgi:hypothetical protein